MLLREDEPTPSFSMTELNADTSPLLLISNCAKAAKQPPQPIGFGRALHTTDTPPRSEPGHWSHDEASIASLIDGTNALGLSLDAPSTWACPAPYLIDIPSTMQICMPPPPPMDPSYFDSDFTPFASMSPFLPCIPLPSSTPSHDVALTTLTSWKPDFACTDAGFQPAAGGLSVEDMQRYAAGVKDRLLTALQTHSSRECDAVFLETRWMREWASCVHLPRPVSPGKVSRDVIVDLERQCEWVKCRL
ncbi:hypothetical protein FB45DRAFT_1035399 [Roridomyces roridus]|uniref:Uncharacterized protein n=1 Tax=Roridomyces roridus TaxID=1738132 RepID=A0AAD7BA63_9AGAR|nr:hypothetical protein FB45DRAFT_1035399 [Roridomyces roridus]